MIINFFLVPQPSLTTKQQQNLLFSTNTVPKSSFSTPTPTNYSNINRNSITRNNPQNSMMNTLNPTFNTRNTQHQQQQPQFNSNANLSQLYR